MRCCDAVLHRRLSQGHARSLTPGAWPASVPPPAASPRPGSHLLQLPPAATKPLAVAPPLLLPGCHCRWQGSSPSPPAAPQLSSGCQQRQHQRLVSKPPAGAGGLPRAVTARRARTGGCAPGSTPAPPAACPASTAPVASQKAEMSGRSPSVDYGFALPSSAPAPPAADSASTAPLRMFRLHLSDMSEDVLE